MAPGEISFQWYTVPTGNFIGTLWLFNSLPWYRWPIEIDGLPIKNGDFPWLCEITRGYIIQKFKQTYGGHGFLKTKNMECKKKNTWQKDIFWNLWDGMGLQQRRPSAGRPVC